MGCCTLIDRAAPLSCGPLAPQTIGGQPPLWNNGNALAVEAAAKATIAAAARANLFMRVSCDAVEGVCQRRLRVSPDGSVTARTTVRLASTVGSTMPLRRVPFSLHPNPEQPSGSASAVEAAAGAATAAAARMILFMRVSCDATEWLVSAG